MKWIQNFLASLFISGIFSFGATSQDIIGEWKIDYLLLDSTRNEYVLSPVDTSDQRYNYGNHVRLLTDNSFQSWYTAPCGNDCFTSSTGRYVFIDPDHIQFFVDTITKHGECEMEEHPNYPINLGLFYMRRDSARIGLYKSNGDVYQDSLNVAYSDLLSTIDEQRRAFQNLIEPIRVESTVQYSPENVALVYLSTIQESDYRLLYSEDLGYRSSVHLIEVKNKQVYLFCSSTWAENKEVIYEVGQFDVSFVDEIVRDAQEIDREFARRKPEIKEKESAKGYLETSKVFQNKKKGIEKVVYQRKFTKGSETSTYYLNEGKLFLVRVELDRENGKIDDCMEFYLKPNGEFASKEISRSRSGGIGSTKIHECKQYLATVLEGND